ALTRHVDEARGEALERIAANEQRDALPFLEVENTNDRIEQLVFIGLKQFVARESVQDMRQRLAVMARRCKAGAFYDPTNLATQQWDRARAAAVRQRGEMP